MWATNGDGPAPGAPLLGRVAVSYAALASLAVAVAVSLDVFVLRTRLLAGRVFWTAYAIVCCFQLLINGVLTGRGVVRYDRDAILGPRLFHAPVEDLMFGFSLVTVTLALWVWAGRRGVGGRWSRQRP